MHTKMKILFTTTFYPPFHIGGDATHVKYLAEALAEKGHNVHVMFSMDAYEFKRKEKPKMPETWNGVKVHVIESPLGKLEPILNYIFGTQKYTYNYFKNLLEKEKFDVVHHHNISLLGYNILKKIGTYRNIYTAHDCWLICHKHDYFKFGKICDKRTCFSCTLANGKPYLFHRLGNNFKTAIDDVDLIIAPSKFMKNELTKYLKNKIKAIYNFVPYPAKRLPPINHKNYFLFVGNLVRNKGILELIDVFKKIPEENLLIVGKGDLDFKIKKIIEEHNNIKFLGWKAREEVLAYMKNAKALILPSLAPETMPLIIIEALSVGTVVIGSNIGGVGEILKKIDTELLFNPINKNVLRKKILAFNETKYNKNKLINLYKENYSTKAYLKELRKIGYFK